MICTEVDQFIVEYQEMYPSWIVWLDSGLVVYQDDYRQNVKPYSAWERLGTYCKQNDDHIVNMVIQFRTNQHPLPTSADGYYFSKGARGGFSMSKTMKLFFVGTLQQDKLSVTCWKVPEMLQELTEERNPNEAGICLIKRNTNLSMEQ